MSDSVLDSIKVDLSGQVAVVTGASQGIGKSIAFRLADAGAHVVCAARSINSIKEVANQIKSLNRSASFKQCDVKNPEDIKDLIDKLIESYKMRSIKVIIDAENDKNINKYRSIVNSLIFKYNKIDKLDKNNSIIIKVMPH